MNAPQRQSVLNHLIDIIARSLQIPADSIQPESRFFLDLEAESIDILDIRFAVEKAYGFKFKNEEIRNLLDKEARERGLSEKDIPELFTVESMLDFILLKMSPSHEQPS